VIQEEIIAVRNVLKSRRLRKTRRTYTVRDAERGVMLRFMWDGAGLDSNGELVLLEAELSPIQDWHIGLHVARLPIMLSEGCQIRELAWVTQQHLLPALMRSSRSWHYFISKASSLPLPKMSYWSRSGDRLFQES